MKLFRKRPAAPFKSLCPLCGSLIWSSLFANVRIKYWLEHVECWGVDTPIIYKKMYVTEISHNLDKYAAKSKTI